MLIGRMGEPEAAADLEATLPVEPVEPPERADAAPTVVDARVARGLAPAKPADLDTGSKTGGTLRTSGGSRSTSVITARETLHLQEVAQTRAFVRLSGALAVIVAIAVSFMGGDPLAKKILYGALAAVVVVNTWLAWDLRDDERYSIQKVVFCGLVCITAAFAAVYYFGIFGPAVVVIPFGLCFFSSGGDTRGTFAIYATCASVQLLLSLSTMTGAIADRGLIRAASVGAWEKLSIVTLIEAIFLATYVIMRQSRAATLRAIELHDKALAQVSQREALLKEARQDLAQALRANGVGRYTEHVLGGFQLGDVIGRGAMGEVYEAFRVSTREPAAVKVLLDHVLAQPEQVQRFHREAKLAASLEVVNVVRILAVADVDAAIPYIAMERLRGLDLADWLREHRRMSMSRLLGMIRQIGVGLAAARAKGIVHRDLKPRNVFLCKEGDQETWKLLDFGVSKLVNEDHTLTREKIIGTPTYMAPEQVTAGKVTHRTDLFALGVIVYRAMTGRPAFAGDSEGQILYKVVHSMPPRPSEVVPVPSAVDDVMAIALAKDAADRFDSAEELADALEAASQGVIDPALSARAEGILAQHPWGS